MQKTIKNIGAIILVSAFLSGCQTMLSEGSSTNGGGLVVEPTNYSRFDSKMIMAKKNFRSANFGLAESNFRQLVELHPGNGEAWLGLAASYDQLGLFDRSDRAYSQAIKLVGPKPAILNNQGYSQLLRGNKKAARRLFRKAAKLAPENARIKGNMELLKKS